jgi:hypothetical protein
MNVFKQFFNFYLSASIHIGFAVLALTIVTDLSLKIPQQSNFYEVVFFGTVFGYNVLRYFDAFNNNLMWFAQNPTITLVSILSCALAAYHFLELSIPMQLSFIAIAAVIILYPALRRFGLIKMFLVSFSITTITVYIPTVNAQVFGADCFFTFLQRYLIVISLLIPFEISDSKTDHPSLQTLPQEFGIRPTKIFGMLLLIPFVLLEFFKTNTSYSVFIVSITTVLFIHFSSVNNSKYYTSFWVESVPIFWWLLLYII